MSNWPQLSSEFSSLNSSISTPYYRDFNSNYTKSLQQNHYNTNSQSTFPSLRDVSLSFNYEEMIGNQGRSFGPSLLERRIEEPSYYAIQPMPSRSNENSDSGRWFPGFSSATDTYFPRNMDANQNVQSQNYEPDPIASMLQQRQHKVQGIPSLRSLFVPESSSKNSTSNKNNSSKEGVGLVPQMHLVSTICERDQRKGYRLKRLLGLPMAKELWLETATGRLSFDGGQIVNRLEENRTYYYNISTLRVSFEMPSPLTAIIRQQTEVRKMLDMTTPCTIIVTRCYNQLTEEVLHNYFKQYGEVAFARVFSIKAGGTINPKSNVKRKRKLAYIRMESVQVQKRLLEQTSFTIDGHIVELRIPSNRIFISRVPEEAQPIELIQFVEGEIKKFEPRGYCVDAYFPHPFCQFVFCTVGGPRVSARLAIKADFFFRGSSVGISTCCDDSELDADRLLEQKIKDLVEQNDYARIRSLQSISAEVKSMILILAKMKKFSNEISLLMVINSEFLKSSEEKLRSYLCVQDNVFEMCKKVAMEINNENNQSTERKRIRIENDQEKERAEELSECNVEEDIELDDES
ncbi:hypothetical protein ACQ4LE_008225 [Meloidogyne hapla]